MKPFGTLLLTFLLCSSACSLNQTVEMGYDAQKSASAGTKTQRSLPVAPLQKANETSDVEVLWSADPSEIDGYLLEYGFQADSLTRTKRVALADLEEKEDVRYGKVYRTLLPSVPTREPVFVVIRAYKGDALSPRSAPITIPPVGNQ